MYVWYGTNEYNFEKLADPPTYAPTHCDNCGAVIRLALESYTQGLRASCVINARTRGSAGLCYAREQNAQPQRKAHSVVTA